MGNAKRECDSPYLVDILRQFGKCHLECTRQLRKHNLDCFRSWLETGPVSMHLCNLADVYIN